MTFGKSAQAICGAVIAPDVCSAVPVVPPLAVQLATGKGKYERGTEQRVKKENNECSLCTVEYNEQ